MALNEGSMSVPRREIEIEKMRSLYCGPFKGTDRPCVGVCALCTTFRFLCRSGTLFLCMGWIGFLYLVDMSGGLVSVRWI